MDESLFDVEPMRVVPSEPAEKLSADRRRTLRQSADIQAGRHPLTRGRLSPDAEARCGNCRFRVLFAGHARSYPKCTQSTALNTSSAATDVRAWWPGCANHELVAS